MTKKIQHVQTQLFEEDLKKLKDVSGEKQTNDALSKAIHFFIAFSETLKNEDILDLIKNADPTKENMQEIVNLLLIE